MTKYINGPARAAQENLPLDRESAGRALRTPAWAAAYLGMTENWLARLRMSGGGPRYIKQSRKVSYRRDDLDAWIAQRVVVSTSQQTEAARSGVA